MSPDTRTARHRGSGRRARGRAPSVMDEVCTARLRLRRPVWEDSPAVVAIHADPGLPSLEECRAWLGAWIDEWAIHGYGYWAVCLREDDRRVVGFGGITRLGLARDAPANLYYRLAPEVRGRGLAIELASAAVEAAFALGFRRVQAVTAVSNEPSRRVLRRLGMAQVGAAEGDAAGDGALVLHELTRP